MDTARDMQRLVVTGGDQWILPETSRDWILPEICSECKRLVVTGRDNRDWK